MSLGFVWPRRVLAVLVKESPGEKCGDKPRAWRVRQVGCASQ